MLNAVSSNIFSDLIALKQGSFILSHKKIFIGKVHTSFSGAVTPFCSFSEVPLCLINDGKIFS